MKKAWFLIGVGLVTALFAVGAVACGDDVSEEEAEAQLCSDLAELGNALDTYGEIDLESSKSELEDAQDAVNDAYNSVVSSAEDVADIEVADLESAIDALEDAVADVPDDATVAEGLEMVAEEAAAVDAAIADIFTGVDCS